MTAEQFTYWLQGFMETADPKSINETQTQIIKDHLALVFGKVTPDYKNKEVKPEQVKTTKEVADDWYKKFLEVNNIPIDITPDWMKNPNLPFTTQPSWTYRPIQPPVYNPDYRTGDPIFTPNQIIC